MNQDEREVMNINVELRCDHKCENCERFFDCQDPRKWEVYKRRRMANAIKKMAKIKHKVTISGGKGGVGKSTVSVNLATAWTRILMVPRYPGCLASKGRQNSSMAQKG